MGKKETDKDSEATVDSESTEEESAESIDEAPEVELVEDELSEEEKNDNELRELRDEMLRIRAESDNFRRRLTKEKQDAVQYANEKLIKELLPIYDNLNRALEAPETNVKSLKEGVEMIARQFLGMLDKLHVKEISSVGEAFDPNVHEVLSQIESDEHEEGTIIEEYMKGYRMHDRVLIPAKVVTTRKPAGSETASDSDEASA